MSSRWSSSPVGKIKIFLFLPDPILVGWLKILHLTNFFQFDVLLKKLVHFSWENNKISTFLWWKKNVSWVCVSSSCSHFCHFPMNALYGRRAVIISRPSLPRHTTMEWTTFWRIILLFMVMDLWKIANYTLNSTFYTHGGFSGVKIG